MNNTQTPSLFEIDKISNFGWVCIVLMAILLLISLSIIAYHLIKVLQHKNIKIKDFEVQETEKEVIKKEIAMSEGKDQLDNQCQVAKNILKELRIKMYETAIETFLTTNKKDQIILDLISHRIVDRLNYEVKNDLTRNHITHKSNYELELYTRAKARGYYSMIKDRLYTLNEYLPEFNLPEIIERIPLSEVETLFKDVYFSARRITGNNGGTEKNGNN